MLVTLGALRQDQWASFLQRQGLEADLPDTYAETIALVAAFADPILTGDVASGRWEPIRRT